MLCRTLEVVHDFGVAECAFTVSLLPHMSALSCIAVRRDA
jgi:hypothetical protein